MSQAATMVVRLAARPGGHRRGADHGQNPPRWVAFHLDQRPAARAASPGFGELAGSERTGTSRGRSSLPRARPADLPGSDRLVGQVALFLILLDSVESSFRFVAGLQAGGSSGCRDRPGRSRRIRPGVGRWRPSEPPGPASGTGAYRPRGGVAPRAAGATPPGVVASSPGAPMLAGAVALAAGRFQPLLRVDFDKRFADLLSLEQVESFDQALTQKVLERLPNFASLGDDCDFLTIAGDWPYRYRDSKGELEAVDDRLGRSIGSDQRWGFAGRLLGDSTDSVYRAMCSLFLQPESAVMFNGYDGRGAALVGLLDAELHRTPAEWRALPDHPGLRREAGQSRRLARYIRSDQTAIGLVFDQLARLADPCSISVVGRPSRSTCPGASLPAS